MQFFVLVDSQVVESYVKVAAIHAVDESLRFCGLCAGGVAIRRSGLELGPEVSSGALLAPEPLLAQILGLRALYRGLLPSASSKCTRWSRIDAP